VQQLREIQEHRPTAIQQQGFNNDVIFLHGSQLNLKIPMQLSNTSLHML
jgi:hypothetical protein